MFVLTTNVSSGADDWSGGELLHRKRMLKAKGCTRLSFANKPGWLTGITGVLCIALSSHSITFLS